MNEDADLWAEARARARRLEAERGAAIEREPKLIQAEDWAKRISDLEAERDSTLKRLRALQEAAELFRDRIDLANTQHNLKCLCDLNAALATSCGEESKPPEPPTDDRPIQVGDWVEPVDEETRKLLDCDDYWPGQVKDFTSNGFFRVVRAPDYCFMRCQFRRVPAPKVRVTDDPETRAIMETAKPTLEERVAKLEATLGLVVGWK